MKPILMSLVMASSAFSLNLPVQSELGKGILLSDQDAGLKDECVLFDRSRVAVEDARITTYELTLVKSKEELSDRISFSGSAKGSYGVFSAGAKAKFVKEVEWNYNSNYILVRATRLSQKQNIDMQNVLMTPYAQNVLRNSKARFLESCGNSFATSVEMGGEIYGLIEIKAESYQEKQHIESSIKGSGSFGRLSASAKASYERTIRKLSTDYKAKVDFQHVGGSHVNVPNTVDGLLELSNRIEEISDAHPVPLAIITRDYFTLSNYPLGENDPEIAARQAQVDWGEAKLKEARNLYSKILYILENPSEFRRFNESELKQKLGYLDTKIVELKGFVARSYSFTNPVDIQTLDIKTDDIILPAKKYRAPLNVKCEEKPSPICGVAAYREERSRACGQAQELEGTGPVCGAIYKEMESPVCGVKQYKLSRGKVCGVERRNRIKLPVGGGYVTIRIETIYKECRDPSFGVESYNSCRNESNGIEKYKTCKNSEFGIQYPSCAHFSHGPATYLSCEVSEIGIQETYCPKF